MSQATSQKMQHQGVIKRALMLVGGMFCFGFAMVPMYEVLCELTGLNGQSKRLQQASNPTLTLTAPDPNRTVRVQFDASVNSKLDWEFIPEQTEMVVKIGELTEAWYDTTNRAATPIVGTANPSVAPGVAAGYFRKTECFCFTDQRLEGKQSRRMVVRFMIDPQLPDDVEIVTLAYTFHRNDKATAAASKAVASAHDTTLLSPNPNG
jgi:cytochrome c oxidase assembly protein subunit 11